MDLLQRLSVPWRARALGIQTMLLQIHNTAISQAKNDFRVQQMKCSLQKRRGCNTLHHDDGGGLEQ